MPTLTIEYRDDSERLALEQATVLAVCEQLALDDGRKLLRSTLAAAVESRIAAVEQKGGPPVCALKRTPDAPRAATVARS